MPKYKYLTTNGIDMKTIWAWARQLVDDLNRSGEAAVPTGTVAMSAASSVPIGWLLCDGASYAVNDQRLLFSVIGYAYGGSAGNFNVPDYTPSPISGVTFIIKA